MLFVPVRDPIDHRTGYHGEGQHHHGFVLPRGVNRQPEVHSPEQEPYHDLSRTHFSSTYKQLDDDVHYQRYRPAQPHRQMPMEQNFYGERIHLASVGG